MIVKNYKNLATNSRIGRVYISLANQLSQNSCPNCWGVQEYDFVQLDGHELKAPKKSYGSVSLIQQLAKHFVS